MLISGSKKYFQIAWVNVRHNFLPHFALSILLLAITPAVFGTANLTNAAAYVPLEMFTALIGIVLMTPVFLPEQEKEIRDVVEVKYTNQNIIYIIRITSAALTMLILISCFVFYMKLNGCIFDTDLIIFGTFAGSLFLGSLGLFSYGASENIAFGYMIPMGYYILNMLGGKKYFGNFYLFSMIQGSFSEKYWLMAASFLLIISVLLLKNLYRKTR